MAPCHVVGEKTTLDNVNVSTLGLRFTLGLKDVPTSIELAEGQPDARVHVRAPLRFTGTYPEGKLALSVAATTDLYGSRIRLGQGAAPTWLGVQGNSMLLSVERMLGVVVKQPLAIACSRLAVSDGSVHSPPDPALAGGHQIGIGSSAVPFHLEPEDTEPLEISYRGAFVIQERRPGWVRLAATWSDGSKLEGWTPERHTSEHIEGWDRQGEEWVGRSCGRVDAPALSKVTLQAGAAVAAYAAGPVWAHVTRDVEVDVFPSNGSDEWIRVGSVAGLPSLPEGCSDHEHIWVHVRDVRSAN